MRQTQARILIAGTHSGVGKTTITMGIALCCLQRGLSVQCFKIGPDYLDALLLKKCSRRVCYNLDLWLSSLDYLDRLIAENDADVLLIEGVMGLFDHSEISLYISRYRLHPFLVFSAQGMGVSAAALVEGYAHHRSDLKIAGAIANYCGSLRHEEILRSALSNKQEFAALNNPPLIGILKREPKIILPSRHLGIHVSPEKKIEQISAIRESIENGVAIDHLLDISQTSEKQLEQPHRNRKAKQNLAQQSTKKNSKKPVLSYAWDEAFYFYYPDNFDLLRNAGFDLQPFSPIHSQNLPENTQFIYIGGGYPESYCEQLAKNEKIIREIQNFAAVNGYIYGECGGMMYLSESITDLTGKKWPLVGALSIDTEILSKFQKLTYVEIEFTKKCLLGKNEWIARGHEYHYSRVLAKRTKKEIPTQNSSTIATQTDLYKIIDRRSKKIRKEGYQKKNTLASYIHIHFASQPKIPQYIYQQCNHAKM